MLLLLSSAEAAGFHYVRAEAIGGLGDGEIAEGGVGASLISDIARGWITFGDPARDGHVVRAWRVSSAADGPVLGLVPRDFRGLVRPYDVPFVLPWLHGHVGGDALARKHVEAEVAGHYVLNVPGFWEVDPRRAHLGPTAGLALNGTWWDEWRDEPGPAVMTGKVRGEAGLVGGVTARDTWYAQAHAVASLDLFGIHQVNVGVAGVTGLYLARLGVPLGVEVRGELDRGNDTVTTRPETHWSLRTLLFWKLAPPFQTRIEERIERRREEARR